MTAQDTTGRVLTVLGPVDPIDLGLTITHEHLLIDLGIVFIEPDDRKRRFHGQAEHRIDQL